MKALIIGAAGFVGGYLIQHLHSLRWEIAATKLPHERMPQDGVSQVLDLDVQEPQSVLSVLQRTAPDVIYHLAAQSSVKLSWENPAFTVHVNVLGALNVLESARTISPPPRLLLIGSGEEYGSVLPQEVPISEDTTLRPGNIYAVTKATQSMLGSLYAKAYRLPVICVRAFNHVGPGQSPAFVVADFCQQIARIERGGQEPILRVGNLSACRDFTSVQDVVRAYSLLAQRGTPGEVYNVGSGRSVSIRAILDLLLAKANIPIEVFVDPSKFRPVDVPDIQANVGKIFRDTGWKPSLPLEQTLQDTLDFFRSQATL